MKDTYRPRWNPEIFFRQEEEARKVVLAALEEGKDVSSEGVAVLMVDGMMHELNLLGAEIWARCDGRMTVAEIAKDLEEKFDADPAEIETDVREFVADLHKRGWLV